MNFWGQEETQCLCGALQHLYGIVEHNLQIFDLAYCQEWGNYRMNGREDSKEAKMDISESIRKFLDQNLYTLPITQANFDSFHIHRSRMRVKNWET